IVPVFEAKRSRHPPRAFAFRAHFFSVWNSALASNKRASAFSKAPADLSSWDRESFSSSSLFPRSFIFRQAVRRRIHSFSPSTILASRLKASQWEGFHSAGDNEKPAGSRFGQERKSSRASRG